MTSHVKNRRRFMKWERYHTRFPASGKYPICGGAVRIHNGYAAAFERCTHQGRYYPIGIRRTPWMLSFGKSRT
jgi:hypothetical protein